jgi:hypothetical protein
VAEERESDLVVRPLGDGSVEDDVRVEQHAHDREGV